MFYKSFSTRTLVLFFLFLLILLLLLFSPFNSSFDIGGISTGDFRPYWSATYLLAHGQDFSDPGLVDNIERTLTGWDKPFTMMAWFAPSGMVILLPFTLFPFEQAAFFWFLTNVMILSATTFLLWKDVKRKIWIPLLAVFAFPMTLLSLYVGQVNTLVLFGLAVFVSLKKPEHQYLQGIGLALTTIKPHLVILTLPLIILDSIYKKQWKILVGFFGSLLVCSIILFALYPSWPVSFWNLVTSGMSTIRETPTISGLIAFMTGQVWGKWLWISGLVLSSIIWWKTKKNLDPIKMINFSIILGLLISPIGWGYDQIMLLIPILYLSKIINQRELPSGKSINSYFLFIIIYGISLFMRTKSFNEVWFSWVPIFLGIIFLLQNLKTNDN